MKPRILLVREWDAQVSASGCCGRLGGVHDELGDADTFAHNRREMQTMGAVYQRLYDELGGAAHVDLEIVDPRNMVWLVPAIARDAWRRGLSVRATWRQMRRGVAYNAIVVNGEVLFSGRIPPAEEVLAAVKAALTRPSLYAA